LLFMAVFFMVTGSFLFGCGSSVVVFG